MLQLTLHSSPARLSSRLNPQDVIPACLTADGQPKQQMAEGWTHGQPKRRGGFGLIPHDTLVLRWCFTYGLSYHFSNLLLKEQQNLNDYSAARVDSLFVSSGILKCRLLKWLLGRPMNAGLRQWLLLVTAPARGLTPTQTQTPSPTPMPMPIPMPTLRSLIPGSMLPTMHKHKAWIRSAQVRAYDDRA